MEEPTPTKVKGTWKQPWLPYPEPTDAQLQRLVELLRYNSGYTLRGLTVKADDDGWLIVLKGSLDGQPAVHFTGGSTWQDALEVLVWEITHKALHWKDDRYAR